MFFRHKRLHELLVQLAEFTHEPAANADMRNAVPLYELQRWTSLESNATHAGVIAVRSLLQEGQAYRASLPLEKIGAVANSKGGSGMYLDRLPETMNLLPGEGYGPLSESELKRLQEAVFRRFGLADSRFQITYQEWDQLYIAANTGASRRFALWRRLMRNRSVDLPAIVTPYRLNEQSFRSLREEYRTVGLKENKGLELLLLQAGESGKSFAYLKSPFSFHLDRALFLLPYPHMLPKAHASLLLGLHRRVEPLFDLGRYLAERIASRSTLVT